MIPPVKDTAGEYPVTEELSFTLKKSLFTTKMNF